MLSTTTQNKPKILIVKTLKALAVTAFWILVWEAAARFAARDNELMYLLLPRPLTVFEKWREIAFTSEFLTAVGYTLARVMSGFLIGTVTGLFFGVLTHLLKPVDWVLSPLFKVIRAVPVVAITVLFFALFESRALPVWVAALMVTPLIWQTVYDGLGSTPRELTEMAKVYKIGAFKTFLYIKLPHSVPQLITSTVNALGLAWKSGIAAEVICEPRQGLGTVLIGGKGMIDFSTVYAVTLTVVVLSIVIEILLRAVCRALLNGKENDK